MYTGIVQGKFKVTKVDRKPGLHTLQVQLGEALLEGLNNGSSVGVDGVCLTVAGIDGDKLDVRFDKAGVKKIVARFVVAADQAGDVPF